MFSIFGMCFNWKVLAGIGVVFVGVLIVAPGLITAVVPLLLLAACPLSMLLMMRAGHGHSGMNHSPREHPAPTKDWLEQRVRALAEEQRKLEADIRHLDGETPEQLESATERRAHKAGA